MGTRSSSRWRASWCESPGHCCGTRPHSPPAELRQHRGDRLAATTRRREAVEDLRVVETRWPDSHRCSDSLRRKMALDAGPFTRLGTLGSPSWPGFDPETGYVDADCSD